MRKWLVEETGEFRSPLIGEYALGANSEIDWFIYHWMTLGGGQRSIVKITELIQDHKNNFDEWNW